MVLARNTYRFALLLVGYAIASGLDDIRAYHSEGLALLALGIGGFALFVGTLSHYVPEGRDAEAGDDPAGCDRTGGAGPDDRDDSGDGADEGAANGPESGAHVPWGWY